MKQYRPTILLKLLHINLSQLRNDRGVSAANWLTAYLPLEAEAAKKGLNHSIKSKKNVAWRPFLNSQEVAQEIPVEPATSRVRRRSLETIKRQHNSTSQHQIRPCGAALHLHYSGAVVITTANGSSNSCNLLPADCPTLRNSNQMAQLKNRGRSKPQQGRAKSGGAHKAATPPRKSEFLSLECFHNNQQLLGQRNRIQNRRRS